MQRVCAWVLMSLAVLAAPVLGQTNNASEAKPKKVALGRGAKSDYGRFLAYSVSKDPKVIDGREVVTKGITIRVGANNEGAVLFDTNTLRYAAGWTGGFLDLTRTHMVQMKGTACAFVAGPVQWGSSNGPGWAYRGSFDEVRTGDHDPLPRERAHYKGMYVHGERVVLKYTVGESEVLESPDAWKWGKSVVLRRMMRIGGREELSHLVCEVSGEVQQANGEQVIVREKDGARTLVGVVTDRPGVKLEAREGRVILRVPARDKGAIVDVVICRTMEPGKLGLEQVMEGSPEPMDPVVWTKGGPARWGKAIEVKGRRGDGAGAYVVDTIPLPDANPWEAWLRATAFDFFSDGKRAALSTWNGDVWVVSGIDEGLSKLTWRRFASGLFEGLGLKSVNDQVYVLERGQITRLHDLNGDGEADYYENFNNDCPVHPTYHDFAYDLQTDSQGNFYYARTGHRVPTEMGYHGAVLKVAKDGSGTQVIAGGLRAANGMSVGPADQITVSDNQGNYVPASRVTLVKPGGFYGFAAHPHRHIVPAETDPPLVWIPHSLDNSSGSQEWVTSKKWGPLEGKLLHTSYGTSSLFVIYPQEVEGQWQGAFAKFPLRFASGIMRARFNPADGQLYVCGLKGWQTNGTGDGCFQRVRYTGKAMLLPADVTIEANGVRLTFDVALETASAGDAENWAVERWNYLYSKEYGSADYSIDEPGKKGRDAVEIKSAKVSADGKSVLLEIADMRPAMQMRVQGKMKGAGGVAVPVDVYATVHRVPKAR